MEEQRNEPTHSPSAVERIEEIFRAFEAKGAPHADREVRYVFDLQGEEGGRHLLEVAPGTVRWEAGYAGDADVLIRLSVDDFLATADGTFDGRLAVASERIEITGDLDLAEQLLAAIEADEA